MSVIKRVGKPLCGTCTRDIELKGKKVRCGEEGITDCPFYVAIKVYEFPDLLNGDVKK